MCGDAKNDNYTRVFHKRFIFLPKILKKILGFSVTKVVRISNNKIKEL